MTNASALPTALLSLTLGHSALLAQCPNPTTWVPGGTSPCPSGSVLAMTKWDPDGPGPLGVHVVCGGDFGEAGAALTSNIALFDPVTRTWSALPGFDGPVLALAVAANGTLVAGGSFQQSGSTIVANVAQWNGSAWSPLGVGTNSTVFALAFQPNGELIAGGAFTSAGGVPANCIARWNGSTWSALGSGITGVPPFPVPSPIPTYVRGLGVRPNGDLLVTGEFALAGGVQANGVARWNGAAWSSLGFGPATMRVTASRVLANGDLLVGTDDWAGNYEVRRWNGATWTTLGLTSQMPWLTFGELANGTLLAQRQDGFFTFSDLRAWNGVSWVPYGGSLRTGPANTLLEFAPNDLWMSCSIGWFGAAATIRRWNGSTWQVPGAGLDGDVAVALPYRGGFVIGGDFSQVGSTPSIGLAMRSNGTWSALGGGIDGSAYALAELPGGDLLVGGTFAQAGSLFANNIARWNGAQWLAMGSFLGAVYSLAVGANGDVFAGSMFPLEVSRWNGSAWVPLGTLPLTFTPPYALVGMPNGDVVVGLGFGSGNSPMVLRWDGVAWSPLGSGLPGSGSGTDVVYSLCVLPNGDLVAGGRFAIGSTTSVARWDGTSWQPMGAGLPSTCLDLDLLPGGDLLATHWQYDDQGAPVVSPSRWNGVAWQAIPGLDAGQPHQSVSRAAVADQGEVLLAGSFGRVQLVPSGGIASLYPGCPATSVSAGSGCVGSSGPVQLSVLANAWLGSTYRARTTGLPTLAIAVQVFGLASVSLPLASVLPSFPGCTLHVSPDVLLADLPTAGAVTAQWALPNSASLLGQSFRQQTVPFELAASGAITAVSASNAVQLTIGAW